MTDDSNIRRLGNPPQEISEALFVQKLDINWKLLREQKQILVNLLDERGDGDDPDGLLRSQANALQGIINLLDGLQDEAAEVIGEFAVFGGQPCEGCHSKPPHEAHVLAFQPKRLMGTEPERWLPVCSDRAGDWWDLQGGGNTEEERTKAGAPERWLKPLETSGGTT